MNEATGSIEGSKYLAAVHSFAQTNLQLYNQMLSGGYSTEDVEFIAHGYVLASELFTAQFRPTGKPFLAHLVGTASILAWSRAPARTVCVGLMHASILFGDFGREITLEQKRAVLRARLGEDLERMTTLYADFMWNPWVVALLHKDAMTLTPESQEIVRIRLANELEDFLDLGLLYCRKGEQEEQDGGEYHEQLVALAEKLGESQLAAALRTSIEQNRTGKLPPADLRLQFPGSSTLAPASYQRRGAWSDGVASGKHIIRGVGRRILR